MKKTYTIPAPSPDAPFVSDAVDLSKFIRKSRPPFVHAIDLPVGSVFAGKILGVQKGKVNGKATSGFLIKRSDGTEHVFPINPVIESALGDKPEKFVGKEIAFRVLQPKKSAKYRKEYFNAEVFVK